MKCMNEVSPWNEVLPYSSEAEKDRKMAAAMAQARMERLWDAAQRYAVECPEMSRFYVRQMVGISRSTGQGC